MDKKTIKLGHPVPGDDIPGRKVVEAGPTLFSPETEARLRDLDRWAALSRLRAKNILVGGS